MNVVFRFDKGYGNDRLYYRLRSSTNEFFDFTTQGLSPIELATTKIFLTEVTEPQDPWENMYVGIIPLEKVGWYEEEVVDQVLNLVVGEGMVDFRVTYLAKTKASINLSKGPIRFRKSPPRISFRVTPSNP